MRRTCGKRSRIAATESSLEWLSITQASQRSDPAAAGSDARQAVVSARVFQLTITTETSGSRTVTTAHGSPGAVPRRAAATPGSPRPSAAR